MRLRSSGFVVLWALLCAFQASAINGQIIGVKRPALKCAPAYGVFLSQIFQVLPVEHLKNFKIAGWSMNEFRIRGAGNYELKTDWQDQRRPRSYDRAKFLSEEQLQIIKQTILLRSPDVLLMTEIIDLASLRMFANHPRYLNGAYEVYVHPVNQLGSNIAFLVKKG